MQDQVASLGGTIFKTFKYRLIPTDEQRQVFAQNAGACRFVYNWGLARWSDLHQQGQKSSAFDLIKELTLLKNESAYGWLQESVSHALQQSLTDLGQAFQNFFKHGKKYPRFKKKNQTTPSFRIPDCHAIDEEIKRLRLSKLGWVNYRQDRKIQGTPKSITVSYRAGHWYASVLCEMVRPAPVVSSKTVIGVDVGISKLATTWDGEQSNFIRHGLADGKLYRRLSVLQKQLSHKDKGSRNRNKTRVKVAKLHKRIADTRLDTLHKLSTHLSKNHAVIGVECLNVSGMMKSASRILKDPGKKVQQKQGLNRSIGRQGWSLLVGQLLYKANWYGSSIVHCEAAYTSQTCPACSFVAKENRKTQALFKCLDCGYSNNADIVGAMNIRGQMVNSWHNGVKPLH